MGNIDLGKEKINKLLLTFSIPCVISMLINSIYNIVDQIFIGKGVGTLGNAATNVIFPLVIVFNAIASLVGNGAAANMSLKLGENKKNEASKGVGQALLIIILVSLVLGLISFFAMPKLVLLFGCTKNVYDYALEYGRIISVGAPFMIIYSALSNIIRADGSPKYSMIMLVVGAIINIILDPIFIFVFNKGVAGGAIATVIGQFVSFILAILYIKKFKSVKISKKTMKLDKDVFRVLGLGLSSFITQCTVLILFVFMNNMMTKLGANSKYGADIPLSVYGVISKINSIYISLVLGVSIGAQPIIGFNYGAGNKERVKEILRKVLTVNLIIGILFNLVFIFFPERLVGIFIKKSDPSYKLFMEFAVFMCHSFYLIMGLNALEMTGSISIQSLGKVKKATAFSFIRQIILLIPISLLLSLVFNKGIYGIAYAGCISDGICFIIALFMIGSEYRSLGKKDYTSEEESKIKNNSYDGKHIVVTISREYASGGRYVGKLLADTLGINFYDKELIELAANESGLSKKYIEETDEESRKTENDDRIFIAESKVIKKLAKNESCVIVGRCADYILKDNKDVIKVFLYSDEESKVNRAVKYYGLDKKNALKQINKINKEREKHYKFYTNRNWKDFSNYDLIINVDAKGVENTALYIKEYLK
ncbi:MAG: MATE family efflux transporter [Firmicutes bacterium]|nr:MATE family efflux transporter [Bacillota bacterium]